MKTGKLRLIIVDDEPAHIDAIRRSLEKMDEAVDVVTAGTLAQYRQVVADHPPDIVLMDIHLPDGRSHCPSLQ
jgi:CheY-like chemotaxis protein